METMNQIASAAAKAFWGEGTTSKQNHQEPVSGATGNVSKGEPYDAGNMDAQDQSKVASTLNGSVDSTTDLPTRNNEFLDASKEKGSEESADVNPEAKDPEIDVTGDGPRPIEAVAKENGGDAAASSSTNETEPSSSQDSEEGSPESKGTGEQYVRTTGLAADGGDFDAAKPGAGREADRLMEEKGLRGDEGDKAAGGGGSHGKDKPSLGERIKNKLHKH